MKSSSIKCPFAILLILLFLLPACSSSQGTSSDVIAWQAYSKGLQTAATQGKNAFLYFRADW